MPAVADKQPAGETEPMLFLDKSDEAFKAQYLDVMVGGIDQKWKITTAGSYLITLNQLEETISIVKQQVSTIDEEDSLYNNGSLAAGCMQQGE